MAAPTELSLAEVLAALVVGGLVVGVVLPWLGLMAWAGRVWARMARVAPGAWCRRPVARAS